MWEVWQVVVHENHSLSSPDFLLKHLLKNLTNVCHNGYTWQGPFHDRLLKMKIKRMKMPDLCGGCSPKEIDSLQICVWCADEVCLWQWCDTSRCRRCNHSNAIPSGAGFVATSLIFINYEATLSQSASSTSWQAINMTRCGASLSSLSLSLLLFTKGFLLQCIALRETMVIQKPRRLLHMMFFNYKLKSVVGVHPRWPTLEI